MKIIDNRKDENRCSFASLSSGDVFEYDGSIYCKLSEKYNESALNLSNNIVSRFSPCDYVTHVCATLVIEEG